MVIVQDRVKQREEHGIVIKAFTRNKDDIDASSFFIRVVNGAYEDANNEPVGRGGAGPAGRGGTDPYWFMSDSNNDFM